MNTKDLFGKALYEYWANLDPEDLITYTNLTDEERLPVSYLFRSFEEMPEVEKTALQLSRGKILDVGAGSGTHSIYLQEKGYDVYALDFSPHAIKVLKGRKINNIIHADFFSFMPQEKYDTVLFLMNGIGIVEKAIYTDKLFQKLKNILSDQGQAFIHSSDLKYLFETGGGYLLPREGYYGDVRFTVRYKGEEESFDWTYIDEETLSLFARQNGFNIKKIAESEYGDFLLKVWKMKEVRSE
jgi:SAM-dependent methyltransferase